MIVGLQAEYFIGGLAQSVTTWHNFATIFDFKKTQTEMQQVNLSITVYMYWDTIYKSFLSNAVVKGTGAVRKSGTQLIAVKSCFDYL